MDRRTVQVSHRPAGIDCSTFSSAPMGENTQKQCSVGSNGQLDCCCSYQQARGTVSRTMCLEVTHLWIWAHKRNEYSLNCPTHTRQAECSLQIRSPAMDRYYQPNGLYHRRYSENFAENSPHPGSTYLSTRWSDRCTVNVMEGNVGICIPYNSPSEVLNIIISDQCKIMLIAPALPTANWFQVVLSLLIEEPVVLPVTTNMLKQTRAEILYANPRLDFVTEAVRTKGFSEEVAKCIAEPVRRSTSAV